MNEGLLVIVMLLTFVVGYFIMGRLDKFLANSFRTNQEKLEAREPACVILTDGLTDEEIIQEIQRFRERHSHTRIILSDGEDVQTSEHRASGNSN